MRSPPPVPAVNLCHTPGHVCVINSVLTLVTDCRQLCVTMVIECYLCVTMVTDCHQLCVTIVTMVTVTSVLPW